MAWSLPRGVGTGLSVRNSLCSAASACSSADLVPFVVRDASRVSWYTCGPTVYDVSHVGHARLFVSVDVLQRLLADRFALPVDSVMNVTDVDDKLIRRARDSGCDVRALARDMEAAFLADMRALNVRAPSRLTRVTEFVPEIVALIEQIVAAGFAYVADSGSVYFDVRARLRNSTHARLMPSRIARVLADAPPSVPGDGDEAAAVDKRFWADFALWKAAADEPAWPSPFGRGRPGWHIECSAMCRAAFGDHLDVHAGGADLRFPHHENEILQCEAVCGDDAAKQWPNYFLHVGHVHVAGQKMSKSLKNFVSVQECLASHSAEQFRWFCLMHRYDDAVEWSASEMQNAFHQASRVREFIDALRRHVDAPPPLAGALQWREHESSLLQQVFAARGAIDACLRSNFDTAAALHELNRLIKLVSAYMGAHAERVGVARGVLSDTLAYVTSLLDHFGLQAHRRALADDGSDARAAAVADAALAIRERLRAVARQVEHKPSSALLWKLADEVRDEILPGAGLDVRDESPTKSNWRWRL
jgi:cysteinyl-tRNA synthetase